MKAWGFAIPGLAMNASELPEISGLVRLQSPGFDNVEDLQDGYTIEDLAAYHAKKIRAQVSPDDEVLIIGMSMGGMIASVLATTLRDQLPKKARFRFLVTSANHQDLPCITREMLADWYQAKPGHVESFTRILTPFVGKRFREAQPEFTQNYFEYRAFGKNGQSAKSFVKQMDAVIRFDGSVYFANVQSAEADFIHGGADEIMTARHREYLQEIQSQTHHHIVPDLGHMVNFEAPHLFQKELAPHA